jgi:hypothetical protein
VEDLVIIAEQAAIGAPVDARTALIHGAAGHQVQTSARPHDDLR